MVIALVDGFRVALPILRSVLWFCLRFVGWVSRCSTHPTLSVVVLFGFVGWVERSETHQIASLNLIHDFHHLPSQKAKYLVGRNDEMMNMASQQLFGHSHV